MSKKRHVKPKKSSELASIRQNKNDQKKMKEAKQAAADKEPKAAAAKAPAEEAKAVPKPEPAAVKAPAEEVKVAPKAAEVKPAEKVPEKKSAEVKPAEKAPEKKAEEAKPAEKAEEAKPAEKAPEKKAEEAKPAEKAPEKKAEEAKPAEKAPEKKAEEVKPAEKKPEKAVEEKPMGNGIDENLPTPRRSVAFIGSECYPFVKTGGLGDVMYALPKALTKQNCDVKVILPRYKCIPWEYQEKMEYRGSFEMDLCADGTKYYVGIMEYVWDGVVYDFIDNEFFFSAGNPYIGLIDDIPRYCYFGKAALAALNFLDWTPDVIHCHDWQAALVPIYLREMFGNTPVGRSKVMLTIHNLRFQGKYDIQMISYWSNLPMHLFNKDVLKENYDDANMMKGGLTYSNLITTVSGTYAGEIQSPEYGEGLDAHLRYHSGKLRGIVNGIDYDMWDPSRDSLLDSPYDISNVIAQKRKNKLALQRELGLTEDENLFVIGLISRLTSQKGLDLINAILPAMIDGNTQVVVLGTGDPQYEEAFRSYEWQYKGSVCSNIMYDEGRAHKIYAGADALLVPSQFEPCGLTQLIAMHYGTIPIVRETGGLKDTVLPYNEYTNDGNGFTFDRYESGLLLDAVNRAKTLYFTVRDRWDQMVQRDMHKDVSWENSARQYRQLYVDLTC